MELLNSREDGLESLSESPCRRFFEFGEEEPFFARELSVDQSSVPIDRTKEERASRRCREKAKRTGGLARASLPASLIALSSLDPVLIVSYHLLPAMLLRATRKRRRQGMTGDSLIAQPPPAVRRV